MALTIKIDDRPILDFLEQLLERSSDLSPLMDQIGLEMEARVSARFETRRDPNGNEWAKWEPTTEASYPFAGTPAASKLGAGRGKLLERYGDLLDGLSHSFDATSTTIGFDAPYAAYHEFGTKHMPRRGLLTADPNSGTLGAEDREAILDIVANYLLP
ncbi:MAG TPA: phage virion morphogenesis protein [Rhodocyclaceae bacterium]|nr:phage virion morphogenesis protein [Rhodocyclaceae bacterium]